MFTESLPCSGCHGLCCGPVPITGSELVKIKKAVKAMSPRRRTELRNQYRYRGTCIFYDLLLDRCGIYLVRPEICRVFGYHKNLICFRKPDIGTGDSWSAREKHVGLLSVDYAWKDFS